MIGHEVYFEKSRVRLHDKKRNTCEIHDKGKSAERPIKKRGMVGDDGGE